MKSFSTKELQRLMSLYLDGVLVGEARARFEEYLEANPEAASEMEAWKKQQRLLRSRPGISPNEWFWQGISARLAGQKSAPESVFPFSRKYVPVAAVLTVLIAALGGAVLFQQRSMLTKYFSEKREQVQQLYEGNVLQGKLMPLFSHLDKDQVLQFALFGTLPLDAQAKTALHVDESKENGTRIEFSKNDSQHFPAVSVEQFCRDIDATPAQHRSVDSILASAMGKIQESVFLGENKSLAVHAGLATYNRAMMSNIAASLGMPQRRKFKRFLAVSGSPYTFVIGALPRVSSVTPRIPRLPGMEQFVVITPESCSIARVKINVQQILRYDAMTTQEIRSMNERMRTLMREFAVQPHGPMQSKSPLTVFSGSNYLSIKVEDDAIEPQPNAMPFDVVARAPKAVQFQYQMHPMREVPKIFDENSAPPDQPTEAAPVPTGGWRQHSEQSRNIDLDSVIRAPRDRKSRPQHDQDKKNYDDPFEL